jgi:hypothetical protein
MWMPLVGYHSLKQFTMSLYLEQLDKKIISAKHIKSWTDKDAVLSRVRKLIQSGYDIPETELDLKPYSQLAAELSVLDGCLFWGQRVIIPPPGRDLIIKQLHETHPGMTRMKNLARSYIWWPGIDKAIENAVTNCNICQMHQSAPAQAPIHPWECPRPPWIRVHIDHAGPFMGKQFLLLIDAYSKWLEVYTVSSISATITVDTLCHIFATHGLPEQIVSDNGSGFASNEFRKFVERNGIDHIRTSPYHPRSNGFVERAVQTFKRAMKKLDRSIESRISRFLFNYRITPQSTT